VARALIQWSAEQLAKASEIGLSTIRPPDTLEAAGVMFIDADT
jgi:hypothetical protein